MEDFNQLWELIVDKLDGDSLASIVMLMRNISCGRKDFVFKNISKSPFAVLEGAESELQEFTSANNASSDKLSTPT